MKRMVFLLLAMLMLVLTPTMLIRAEAAEIVDSGTCGENLTWTLDDAGTLTISGSGPMKDYVVSPWYSQRASIESVVVEDGVTTIGRYAFSGCTSLTGITLPESLTSIGGDAFRNCTSLTSIAIPEGVTSIGDSAFFDCDSLEKVEITDAGAWCRISFGGYGSNPLYYADNGIYLNGVPITTVVLPENVTSIPNYAFQNCTYLRSITIPGSVTSIGDWAFDGCEVLKDITIAEGVTTIGNYAFQDCDSLRIITIPDSVTTIGEKAFCSCDSLISIVIPDSVTSIDNSAFLLCTSLISITIPDSVTTIGEEAFSTCTSLSSITLPESLLLVRSSAFSNCWNLSTVHYAGTQEQAEEIAVVSGNWYLTDATWHYECDGVACQGPETQPTQPEETTPKETTPKETNPKETTPEDTTPEETGPQPVECPKNDSCILSQFSDIVIVEWYHDGIHFCVEKGIMNGMGEGKFAPNEPTTRAQLVTMLYRLAGAPSVEGKEEPFTDVTSDDWFYTSIVWAYDNKVVNGVSDTEFAPNASVTREQVATILYRYLGSPAGTGKLEEFPDVADVSEYAVAPLTWAVGEGLITGVAQLDGTALLDPAGNATRAQIATILMRHLTA